LFIATTLFCDWKAPNGTELSRAAAGGVGWSEMLGGVLLHRSHLSGVNGHCSRAQMVRHRSIMSGAYKKGMCTSFRYIFSAASRQSSV